MRRQSTGQPAPGRCPRAGEPAPRQGQRCRGRQRFLYPCWMGSGKNQPGPEIHCAARRQRGRGPYHFTQQQSGPYQAHVRRISGDPARDRPACLGGTGRMTPIPSDPAAGALLRRLRPQAAGPPRCLRLSAGAAGTGRAQRSRLSVIRWKDLFSASFRGRQTGLFSSGLAVP